MASDIRSYSFSIRQHFQSRLPLWQQENCCIMAQMSHAGGNTALMIDYLRELNLASVFLRLTLAMFFGGMIGIEREKKRRPAGFRTYMLVCLGATLAGIISQYNYVMINTDLCGHRK